MLLLLSIQMLSQKYVFIINNVNLLALNKNYLRLVTINF